MRVLLARAARSILTMGRHAIPLQGLFVRDWHPVTPIVLYWVESVLLVLAAACLSVLMRRRSSPAVIEAARLAACGLPVFPVRPAGKTPLHRGWQAEATTDATAAALLWRDNLMANIGIACGDACWALDVDGEPGQETLRTLLSQHDKLPLTAASRTGGGGFHILFKDNPRVRNSVRRLGSGLDTRAAGGAGRWAAPPGDAGRTQCGAERFRQRADRLGQAAGRGRARLRAGFGGDRAVQAFDRKAWGRAAGRESVDRDPRRLRL